MNKEVIMEKLNALVSRLKQLFSQAADKTQKSAKAASLKVKIVMEENKINKMQCDLGKKISELVEKDDTQPLSNSQVKELIKAILTSKQIIASVNEEIKAIK